MPHQSIFTRLQVLITWPFMLSLAALLLNDLFLKAAYHNWITGKLSDFSGVFMVTMLLAALVPSHRRMIGLLIALIFAFWKSPLSDPIILFIQSQGAIHFGRVVDYSDLFAVITIPLAIALTESPRGAKTTTPTIRKALAMPIVVLALFAIMGTSVAPMKQHYAFRMADEFPCPDPEEVAAAIDKVAKANGLTPDIYPYPRSEKNSGDTFKVLQYSGDKMAMFCRIDEHGTADFLISGMPSSHLEKKMNELRVELMHEMGQRFKGMEYVVPLGGQGVERLVK